MMMSEMQVRSNPGEGRILSRACLMFSLLLPFAAAGQPVVAHRHMAATANPLATRAAVDVLNEGGTAIDAAIAGQMVLAVVEPQSSGLGGGSILMVWTAKDRALAFYEGLASAPAAVPVDYAHQTDGSAIPLVELERSGRVVAVPGTLKTMAMVHAQHGRLPWPRLFRDAVALAQTGFAMPNYLHGVLMERKDLAGKPAFAAYFGPDGKPLPAGTMLRNPALAETLRRVAEQGADALSTGAIAADIVAAVAQGPLPGSITVADLGAYQPRQRPPVCIDAFGRRICSAAPPVAGGVALLQQLAILDRLHIGSQPPGSVGAAHLMLEASRLTQADRRRFIGDPDQVQVPTAGLLDPGYLDGRARLVRPDRAMERVAPGTPAASHAALPGSDPATVPATTHLSIVDDDGNAVSFTTTINLNFGADILVDGIVLNNAITNFATRPVVDGVAAANAAAPGKRPVTTMAPTIVFGADGRPELVVGAGGGARIIDSVAQTILGVLAWHMDVRTAIEQPRIGAQNNAQELERNTAAAGLADALRAMGHTPKIGPMNAGVQAIAIGPDGLQGWGDPHREGVALGD
jgi:gamma-glutamyltranspeptidase/glutathione hydrolase